MKKILFCLVVLLFTLSCKEEAKNKDNTVEIIDKTQEPKEISFYELSSKNSKFAWNGIGIEGKRTGTIGFESGKLEVHDGQIVSGEFILDLTTIDVWVLKGKAKEELETFLKGDKFLNISKNPKCIFKIVETNKVNDELMMEGDLTLNGETLSLEAFPFTVEIKGNGKVLYFSAKKFDFDRTEWGLEYNSKTIFPELIERIIRDFIEVKIDTRFYRK